MLKFVTCSLCVFQEEQVVNIKLSDYGISRQSFHEGVLGVEGTPGYQAPEVRPGIVYDEKVEIIIALLFHIVPTLSCVGALEGQRSHSLSHHQDIHTIHGSYVEPLQR